MSLVETEIEIASSIKREIEFLVDFIDMLHLEYDDLNSKCIL